MTNNMIIKKVFKVGAFALILSLTACASQIKQLPKEANIIVPETWQFQSVSNDETDSKPVEVIYVENGWLKAFDDKDLVKHVSVALNANPDLLASAAQLKSAIEQVTINGSSLWPNVSANASKNNTDDEVAGVTTEIRSVSASLDVSWEADIWGKLTQRRKSAAYSARAQAELFKAAELSLVANVSRAWFNLVTNKLQLELAQLRLESFERTAGLIDENYKRGLRSALDVYLSRTDVQVQISSKADAQFNYDQSLRTFKTLLGEYPDTDLSFDTGLPTMTGLVPSGLPSELLTRRPDIKASQLQYKSQIANAKAAHRDRFPSISFRGSIGDTRDEFEQLFDNDNVVMTLISGIAQPIFLAGALKSREQQAVYQAQASYASLIKTTLTAFQEVEDSLARETTLRKQHIAIKKAVKFAQGGYDLALDRYQSGIENYTTVLESQRRLFNSKRDEINFRNALVQNRIGIHLALGGDFTSLPDRKPTSNLPSITKR